ncbi:MAG: hypothetical protein WDZ69_01110 [Candidatus Pacearchaeota archaeon]
MVDKKGQMKIQQMAFMLLAVTLFFAIVGMFILMIFFSDLRQSAEDIEERDALTLVSKLANSPEFSCGSAFGGTKLSCVDADKVIALQGVSGKYSGFWGVDGIEIKEIYPGSREITILDGGGSGVGVSNFVALCRYENINGLIQEDCDLARLIVYHGG